MADNIIEQTVKKNSQVLKWIGIIALVLFTLYIIKKYMSKTENLYDIDYSQVDLTQGESDNLLQQPQVQQVQPILGQDMSNSQDEFIGSTIDFKTGGQDILPMDLLPKSQVAGEFDENGSPTTDLSARNYLVTSNNFGIDTTSSSNKNPNLQLRSDIFIPNNMSTGPWMQSTITPNLYQRDFNIGN